MKMTGAEIVVACLLEQGVDTIFGYPGGAILNVYDALYKHRDQITHYLSSHEQGAAHMADGYARATGKVGVCLATSGPGATNLVTGIATAYMDSVPLVAITCNVTLPLLGKDSFQEVDIAGISMPITKHGYIVKNVDDLASTIRKAFRIASTGRPGPVLVDIPKDVTGAVTEYAPMTHNRRILGEGRRYSDEDIDRVIEMIKASKRPYLYVGGGAVISGASEELKKFVERIDVPVCDTLMGKGAFDGHDPHYTGMIGMHGTKTSNLGVSKCDLLIAMGARFTDRVIGNPNKFATGAKIIHIDIDPAEINKNIKVDDYIIGNLREVLHDLNAKLEPMKHTEWMKQIGEMKVKYPLFYDKSRLTGPMVIEALDKLTKGDAIIVTDVGQHQMWAAQYYTYSKPRTLLSSGGLGTMGYGLGAAIGANLATGERTVMITGDASFSMNLIELATAVSYKTPIVIVLLNNNSLGMVRQLQAVYCDSRYSATLPDRKTDFCMVAQGFGAAAKRVTDIGAFKAAFAEALVSDRPYVIEAMIDTWEMVLPMLPNGGTIDDLITEKRQKTE